MIKLLKQRNIQLNIPDIAKQHSNTIYVESLNLDRKTLNAIVRHLYKIHQLPNGYWGVTLQNIIDLFETGEIFNIRTFGVSCLNKTIHALETADYELIIKEM